MRQGLCIQLSSGKRQRGHAQYLPVDGCGEGEKSQLLPRRDCYRCGVYCVVIGVVTDLCQLLPVSVAQRHYALLPLRFCLRVLRIIFLGCDCTPLRGQPYTKREALSLEEGKGRGEGRRRTSTSGLSSSSDIRILSAFTEKERSKRFSTVCENPFFLSRLTTKGIAGAALAFFRPDEEMYLRQGFGWPTVMSAGSVRRIAD